MIKTICQSESSHVRHKTAICKRALSRTPMKALNHHTDREEPKQCKDAHRKCIVHSTADMIDCKDMVHCLALQVNDKQSNKRPHTFASCLAAYAGNLTLCIHPWRLPMEQMLLELITSISVGFASYFGITPLYNDVR